MVLATMAGKYGLGAVVAIDPHQGLSYLGPEAPQQFPLSMNFVATWDPLDWTRMWKCSALIRGMLRKVGPDRFDFCG